MLGAVPCRLPPLFGCAFVVMSVGYGFGFSAGLSGGCVKSGADTNMGCSGGASLCEVTVVSTWSVSTSCASLKLCCVAVDSPLDADEDASGLKLKLLQVGGFWICIGSG